MGRTIDRSNKRTGVGRAKNRKLLSVMGIRAPCKETTKMKDGENQRLDSQPSHSFYIPYLQEDCSTSTDKFDFYDDGISSEDVGNCDSSVYERTAAIHKVSQILTRLNLPDEKLNELLEIGVLMGKYNITVAEVHKSNESTVKKFADPQTVRYCSTCWRNISNRSATCDQNDCKMNRARHVRGAASQQTIITSFSIRNQLEQIVKRHLPTIIKTHAEIHSGSSSLTSFPKTNLYKEAMEDARSFDSGLVVLPITLSFDGFRPTNHSKAELTPLYLRLEGIPDSEKDKEESIVLAGLHSGPGGLFHKNVDFMTNRMLNEIEDIRMRPLSITCANETWRIEFSLRWFVADAKASRLVTGFPDWFSLNGCPFCEVVGTRLTGSSVSFYRQNHFPRRTREEVKSLMITKGFINSLSVLTNPVDQLLDELHLSSEGVLKRLYTDIIGTTSHWPELKLKPRVLAELDESVLTIKLCANIRSQFVLFSKTGSLTGSQIRQNSRVYFPILAFFNEYPDMALNVFMVAYVRYSDLLLTMESEEDVDEAVHLADFLKHFSGTRHFEKYSYKCHTLYEHGVEKVLCHGNLSNTSSAPFEKHHRTISVGFNQYTTNLEIMGKKFLLNQFYTGIEPKPVHQETELPFHYAIRESEAITELSQLLGPSFENVDFWKRINWNGKVINTNRWKRKNNSTFSSYVSVNYGGGNIGYGAVEAFFTTNNETYIILIPSVTRNPIQRMYEQGYAANLNPFLLDTLWKLNSSNIWIREVISKQQPIIVPVSTLLKSMISVTFRNVEYLIEAHN